MSKAGLDNRRHDSEIGHKHGATQIGTLRKIYGQGFAAGYPPTEKLSDILAHLNETSLVSFAATTRPVISTTRSRTPCTEGGLQQGLLASSRDRKVEALAPGTAAGPAGRR